MSIEPSTYIKHIRSKAVKIILQFVHCKNSATIFPSFRAGPKTAPSTVKIIRACKFYSRGEASRYPVFSLRPTGFPGKMREGSGKRRPFQGAAGRARSRRLRPKAALPLLQSSAGRKLTSPHTFPSPSPILIHPENAAFEILGFGGGGQDGMIAALGAVFRLEEADAGVLGGGEHHLAEMLGQHMLAA